MNKANELEITFLCSKVKTSWKRKQNEFWYFLRVKMRKLFLIFGRRTRNQQWSDKKGVRSCYFYVNRIKLRRIYRESKYCSIHSLEEEEVKQFPEVYLKQN